MKFSQIDCISKERVFLAENKEVEAMKFFGRLFNRIIYPKNPKYTFSFYVPKFLYMRSISFCEDVAAEIEERFTIDDLARVLYTDFLEYVKKTNDIHDIYKRLNARSRAKTTIKPYSVEDTTPGIMFEEMRGFEIIETKIKHKMALKGEYLLHDMLEIYQEHTFTLEDILEIVYCDFIDDYRKGLIKKPIEKIIQYVI
jgi:hypothetical protein